MSALNEILSRHFAAAAHSAVAEVEVGTLRRAAFIPQLREVDEQKRTITFVASTETIDRYGDRIKIAGMNLDAYRRNPVVLWAHKAGELPVGKTVEIHKEASPAPALVHTVQFAEHPLAAQVHDLYKGKFLNSVSVGFVPREAPTRILDENGTWQGGYEFGGTELLEISCVPIPANPEAVARAIASGVVTKAAAAEFFIASSRSGQLATPEDWAGLLGSIEQLEETIARLKGRCHAAQERGSGAAARISTAEEFEWALRRGAN